jgi:hypothetical protein
MKLFKGDTFYVSGIDSFAKDELVKYLEKAGLVFAKDGKALFEVGFDDTLGNEGMKIDAGFDKISIFGNGNGLLYGVYEFLERFMGFCFGAYTETFTQKDCYDIAEECFVKNSADLPYRTAVVQFGVWAGEPDRALTLPFIDWLAKNRYNRVLTWVSVYEGLKKLGMIPEFQKRGIKLSVGHHQSIFTFLPPEKYLKTNPEYYRLEKDGNRFNPKDYGGQLVLCCQNDEGIAEVAKNAISWLKENPAVDTLAFWPNDFKADACCCDKCSKYSKIENYLHFENELSKKIAKEMPHIKVDVLIYVDLWECPDGISLCDNIVIDQAAWNADGLRNIGAKDGSSLIGTGYMDNLLRYRKVCKNAVLYDYYMGNYSARQRLVPGVDEMQSIFRHFIQKGVSGSGTQFECFNLWNNLFNFFAFARNQYDTDISFEQMLGKFCALFGKGAQEIKEIMKMAEDICDGQQSIRYMGIYTAKNLDFEKVYALFDKALAKESGVFAKNIKMLRLSFRYSELLTKDETQDEAREPNPLTCIDPTGELSYMSYKFDGYHNKNSTYGIAIPLTNKSDKKPASDWYDL